MTRLNNIFFSADWHIDHANVLEYSNRPFKNVKHMNEVLENNYQSSVGENDTCYFLGDMGMGNGDSLKAIINRLKGTKILILGNHDKGMASMLAMGFDAVMYSSSLVVAKQRVTMSHCPLVGIKREDTTGMRGSQLGENWHGEFRHGSKFSLPDFGQFHLHGHIHSPNGGRSVRVLDKQYDVGVDANNYRPVNISCIESWIARYGR